MYLKLIPGTKGFYASENGEIYDSLGNLRNQYTNGDGYKTASVLLNNGKWKTFGLHRLVALAHIPYKGNLDELTVNHKDKNKLNNCKPNLEWVSNKLNNIHAALLKGSKERPVIVAKSPEGKYEFIDNIYVLCKRFNIDIDLAWEIIKEEEIYKGWLFMFNGVKDTIPNELRKPTYSAKRNNGTWCSKQICVKNIQTQEIRYFKSLLDAAKAFDTTASHIIQAVSKNGKKRLFKKQYLIVEHGSDFPVITQEEYENLLSPGGKNVIAYNIKTRQYVIYTSASSFIKENNLSKKAVTVSLKANRMRLINDWWFTYMTEANSIRLKSIIGVQTNIDPSNAS